MKKLWTALLAASLAFPLLPLAEVNAAPVISVYIEGEQLQSDQQPVMIKGRVLLPLRAIFERLGAEVKWDQRTQTVTAVKDDTKITLPLKATQAKINNQLITLDVPAQNLKGRTMVPVRFVSEALGYEVKWNSVIKKVTIEVPEDSGEEPEQDQDNGQNEIRPVSYVSLRDVGDYGDGRDLQVSFTKPYVSGTVDHYRILIVKAANASRFHLSDAQKVSSSANYTVAAATASQVTLTSGSRDVDGALIQANQSYVAFVLSVGSRGVQESVLSKVSPSITLSNQASVGAVTNLQVSDVKDFGDGRDLRVSFNKVADESRINSYRIFVVRAEDYQNFNLEAANRVSNSNYTELNKTGSNISRELISTSRDVKGDLIRNGVSYRVFVMSVSNNGTTGSKVLSAASSAITLSGNQSLGTVTNLAVYDVSDYNDGRDLRVSFNRVSDESNVSHYRILVVRASDADRFDLTKANNVDSSRYTYAYKGSNYSSTLSSTARDVDGSYIREGISYKVFVLTVGNNGGNALSYGSSTITLGSNYKVDEVSNLRVQDTGDHNNAQDLRVSFNRASNESDIGHYRIFVVKEEKMGSFTESVANSVSSSRYTRVNKNGYNHELNLAADARDTDDELIRNDVKYRVFVLSVSNSGNQNYNNLSSASSSITLTGSRTPVSAATNVQVVTTATYGDGRDVSISFNRAVNESNIHEYRLIIVPENIDLTLDQASQTQNKIDIAPNRGDNTVKLTENSRDINGDTLAQGKSYRVYVLSVALQTSGMSNALSSPSSSFHLTAPAVPKSQDSQGAEAPAPVSATSTDSD